MQSVPITTDAVSSNIDQGEVYNIINLCDKVCQWRATSSTNKTDRHDITEILLKVALNTIKQTNNAVECMNVCVPLYPNLPKLSLPSPHSVHDWN